MVADEVAALRVRREEKQFQWILAQWFMMNVKLHMVIDVGIVFPGVDICWLSLAIVRSSRKELQLSDYNSHCIVSPLDSTAHVLRVPSGESQKHIRLMLPERSQSRQIKQPKSATLINVVKCTSK